MKPTSSPGGLCARGIFCDFWHELHGRAVRLPGTGGRTRLDGAHAAHSCSTGTAPSTRDLWSTSPITSLQPVWIVSIACHPLRGVCRAAGASPCARQSLRPRVPAQPLRAKLRWEQAWTPSLPPTLPRLPPSPPSLASLPRLATHPPTHPSPSPVAAPIALSKSKSSKVPTSNATSGFHAEFFRERSAQNIRFHPTFFFFDVIVLFCTNVQILQCLASQAAYFLQFQFKI